MTGVDAATYIDEFLEHHGVKGQRWGVRRRTSNGTRVSKLPSTSEHRKAAELKKRKPHQLTNKQLDTVNTRSSKENNFRKNNPGTFTKGHNTVKAMLAIGATAAAVYTFTQSPAGKAATAQGKQLFDRAAPVLKSIKASEVEQLTLF